MFTVTPTNVKKNMFCIVIFYIHKRGCSEPFPAVSPFLHGGSKFPDCETDSLEPGGNFASPNAGPGIASSTSLVSQYRSVILNTAQRHTETQMPLSSWLVLTVYFCERRITNK